jgi:single-stranded DNA-binding protein
MSQGAFVTLVGYVAQEPNIRTTRTGKTVTDLRVGTNPRRVGEPRLFVQLNALLSLNPR